MFLLRAKQHRKVIVTLGLVVGIWLGSHLPSAQAQTGAVDMTGYLFHLHYRCLSCSDLGEAELQVQRAEGRNVYRGLLRNERSTVWMPVRMAITERRSLFSASSAYSMKITQEAPSADSGRWFVGSLLFDGQCAFVAGSYYYPGETDGLVEPLPDGPYPFAGNGELFIP